MANRIMLLPSGDRSSHDYKRSRHWHGAKFFFWLLCVVVLAEMAKAQEGQLQPAPKDNEPALPTPSPITLDEAAKIKKIRWQLVGPNDEFTATFSSDIAPTSRNKILFVYLVKENDKTTFIGVPYHGCLDTGGRLVPQPPRGEDAWITEPRTPFFSPDPEIVRLRLREFPIPLDEQASYHLRLANPVPESIHDVLP